MPSCLYYYFKLLHYYEVIRIASKTFPTAATFISLRFSFRVVNTGETFSVKSFIEDTAAKNPSLLEKESSSFYYYVTTELERLRIFWHNTNTDQSLIRKVELVIHGTILQEAILKGVNRMGGEIKAVTGNETQQ